MQPTKLSPRLELFTTRHVAVVEGDRAAAEMLHMFFRLMELECSLVSHGSEAVPTICRLQPDVLILDLDLPDLRALDIARETRTRLPALPILFLSDERPLPTVSFPAPVVAKPHGRFEEMLGLFEKVLEMEE